MANGQIDGFFRRPRAGQPLRSVANVDNLNKVANILNDIEGEGCSISKPADGTPWIITYDGSTSDRQPVSMPSEIDLAIMSANIAIYNAETDRIEPTRVSISVNGIIASSLDMDLEYDYATWPVASGVLTLTVWQSFSGVPRDAYDQYSGGPNYVYSATAFGPLTLYATPISQIPWCRVTEQGFDEHGQRKPPKIECLLEGAVSIYCYRGDATARCYADNLGYNLSNSLIQTSKTIETSLPLSVRNISSGTDGFFDEYPNGRYYIGEGGVVVWRQPEETAHAKNAAKQLLLRRIDSTSSRGLPYWLTYEAILTASQTWINTYVQEQVEQNPPWVNSLILPIAVRIYNTQPGPFQPVCPDIIGGEQVYAAVVNSQGAWTPIQSLIVDGASYASAAAMYAAYRQTADDLAQICDYADARISTVANQLDEGQDVFDALSDFSVDAGAIMSSSTIQANRAASLSADFVALDARIAALEQEVSA